MLWKTALEIQKVKWAHFMWSWVNWECPVVLHQIHNTNTHGNKARMHSSGKASLPTQSHLGRNWNSSQLHDAHTRRLETSKKFYLSAVRKSGIQWIISTIVSIHLLWPERTGFILESSFPTLKHNPSSFLSAPHKRSHTIFTGHSELLQSDLRSECDIVGKADLIHRSASMFTFFSPGNSGRADVSIRHFLLAGLAWGKSHVCEHVKAWAVCICSCEGASSCFSKLSFFHWSMFSQRFQWSFHSLHDTKPRKGLVYPQRVHFYVLFIAALLSAASASGFTPLTPTYQ